MRAIDSGRATISVHACSALAAASLLGLSVTMVTAQQQALLPQVICETDMGGDSDDAAMLGFLNHLADEGVIELSAVMHNGNNDWGAAAISAINTYYGRPKLPIGTYRTAAEAGRPEYHPLLDLAQPGGARRPLSYLGDTVEGHWVRLLAENFPCRYGTRLDFRDAVDLYRDVLSSAGDGRVVIVNGGFLGNLSNLFATFDVDSALATLFVEKVDRMTGAVGGVNTCDAPFPAGMAEHVFESGRHPLPTLTSLGGPIGDSVMVQTTPAMSIAMPIDSPVREAYRFKTEVEHGNRNTINAWNWHIFDVLTSFSTIAWDDHVGIGGAPYYDVRAPRWLDVLGNCSAVQQLGPRPADLPEHREVGMHVPPSSSIAEMSNRLADRYFRDGIYPPPANPGSPEREHRAVTATFADGTLGGLDFVHGHPDTRAEGGRLLVPVTANPNLTGATLMFESRRYSDQTFVGRVAAIPALDQFAPSETTAGYVDYVFWADGRHDTRSDRAPVVRFVAWPGRGVGGQAGRSVYACRVLEPGAADSSLLLAAADVTNVAVGDPFCFRVAVVGTSVQVVVDGVDVFAAPVALSASPPPDGGLSALVFYAVSPMPLEFAVDYAILRPDADGQTHVDVTIDKLGVTWFSYVKHGDLTSDLETIGPGEHVVDLQLVARPGFTQTIPIRVHWHDENPATIDWQDIVGSIAWEGFGSDHWIYGLRLPWVVGDEISLRLGRTHEGERAPYDVSIGN